MAAIEEGIGDPNGVVGLEFRRIEKFKERPTQGLVDVGNG